MKGEKFITPISETGATISLVTSVKNSIVQCKPSEECRPLCEPCTDGGPDCAPDCTCEPCEEERKEHIPDQGHQPIEEDQGCEPNY
jgi:hypothetical protein